jgi:RNA polymerase sigma-70 factor, ECF subfamily
MADESERLENEFEQFVRDNGDRVRRALVGFYGVEIGTEAAAEAMSVAWDKRAEFAVMANPAGYLFRVGQSKARPMLRWRSRRAGFPAGTSTRESDGAALVDLFSALARLKPIERAAVILVKSHGYSYREVAALLDMSEASVNNHVHRGLARLRNDLEVAP